MSESKPFKSVEIATDSIKKDGPPSRGLKPKRKSSFFSRLSQSFRRSSGERGADIDTLRGTHGPDFEGYARIQRGDDVGVGCGCGGGGDDMKERIVLIKGPFVFIYKTEADSSPSYAISLAHMKAKMHSSASDAVTLETNLGDVEYRLTFSEPNIANQFVEAATAQANVGEVEEVRKRLGHERLLKKGTSMRYAEKVAMKKVNQQPEKHVHATTSEMAAITGNPAMAL